MEVRCGDIFLVTLDPAVGSEQGRTRPALIIQNDLGNKFSPTTIIAPITSKVFEKEFPINVYISSKDSGLDHDSTILLNQIRAVDKLRLVRKLSKLDNLIMKKVNLAAKLSLGLD